MIINEVTTTQDITFNDLKVNDYFMNDNDNVIWKKTVTFNNRHNAIQITDNDNYITFAKFNDNEIVHKIEIISINYKKIK